MFRPPISYYHSLMLHICYNDKLTCQEGSNIEKYNIAGRTNIRIHRDITGEMWFGVELFYTVDLQNVLLVAVFIRNAVIWYIEACKFLSNTSDKYLKALFFLFAFAI